MSDFVRVTIYVLDCRMSCHIEHMMGGMPRPRVVRRREFTRESLAGRPSWATALSWGSAVLGQESRRLRASPPP